MASAAVRSFLGLLALSLTAASSARAQEAGRAQPLRPAAATSPAAASPVTRSVVPAPAKPKPKPKPAAPEPARVGLAEAAVKLGLKLTWLEPGRRVLLSGSGQRIEFEAGSRETLANGLRVFLGDPVAERGGRLLISQIDYDLCLRPMVRPDLVPHVPARPKVIALDPGHGGVDTGTQNRKLGLQEKTFTLDVAQRLKRLLEARGFRVVLTRDTDEKVELPLRALAANRARADLMLSLHFNSLPNDAKTRGTEVFTFAPQFQRSTNSWSPAEDDDTEREAAPVNRHDAWSTMLAHAVHRELLGELKTFDRGKKIAHFGVLRGLNCPGVLVESGFLSNEEEGRKIATPAYRQEIAAALAKAVYDYTALVDSLGR